MAIWRTLSRYLSGGSLSRQKGLQSTEPAYSEAPATPVTLDSAMQLSAVYGCTRLITECMGPLPINFFKLSDGGIKTPYPEHALSKLMRGKVNRWQTRQQYIESLVWQSVLLGNDFSAIQRGSDKEKSIISLVPLMTPQMSVELTDSGSIIYEYQESVGVRAYAQETIFHNKLFGNGIVGLSPLAYARNTVAVGQAAERSVNKIYKNGGKPSGVLMIDRLLTKDQRDKIKDNFAELAEGNNDRLFVLEADMKYEQVSLSPQDIELLASRRFQLEEICRFFGVPSVLVNDNSQSTVWGSGISELIQGFYKFTLFPMAVRMADNIRCNLLTPAERDTMHVEFDFSKLLQPSFADRMKTGKEGVTGGLMTPNQYRLTEGWEPLQGGDDLYLQQQMTPIKQLENIARTTQDPAPKTNEAANV